MRLGAVAADHVGPLAERGDQLGDVGGIVLSVAIDEDDHGPPGLAGSGIHGGGLAAVGGEPEGGDAGHLRDDLPGPVGTAVIDGETSAPGLVFTISSRTSRAASSSL